MTQSKNIARIDLDTNTFKLERRQGKNWQGSPLAVDTRGRPIYIDARKAIHWKKNNRWYPIKGCAFSVAFGGDGSVYKRDCRTSYLQQLSGSGMFVQFTNQKAIDITADAKGRMWIIAMSGSVLRRDD